MAAHNRHSGSGLTGRPQFDREATNRSLAGGGEAFGLQGALAVVEQSFPRVAERIRVFWDSPSDCEEYLSSLVMMRENVQQGFPFEVMTALMSIWEFHQRNHGREGPAGTRWAGTAPLPAVFRPQPPQPAPRRSGPGMPAAHTDWSGLA